MGLGRHLDQRRHGQRCRLWLHEPGRQRQRHDRQSGRRQLQFHHRRCEPGAIQQRTDTFTNAGTLAKTGGTGTSVLAATVNNTA
ncbi:MAG: hypothetical protein WDN04_18270 [Rhodospirillales bacterium]